MSLSRRYFLKSSGLAMASFALAPPFLTRTAIAQSSTSGMSGKDRPILIAIFQRGAADGLSMVVPFGDHAYYSERPQIAIPAPRAGSTDTAIDLNGFFGLHPAMSSLKPVYDAGHLAVVHAVGSPDNTRSHFDAQDYMESGAPGNKSTTDGWLNRYLQARPEAKSAPFRAVGFSAKMPRSLSGRAPAVALQKIEDFDIRGGYGNTGLQAEFAAMWKDDTFDSLDLLKKANPRQYSPDNGAQYTGPLGQTLQQIGQLIKADVGLEVAFTDIGGWDTHANQGASGGQLSQRLRDFGNALSAFHLDMGDRMRNIVLITMTEFGRAFRQNGSGGTDHGHASALFVMGGPVKGGKVYAKWPGLAREQLFEGRDLALTTDFRDVFSEIIAKHMGVADTSGVFPGYRRQQTLGIL
jgi:uncharacterized protein (DUF1501 family)